MASIYSWESFIRIHGGAPGARDVFERVMEELLRAENPGKEVHLVKASRGDGGIDVYVHHEDGIDIYQCKFFMGSMDSSRWSQIKNSFSKAMEPKGVKVLRWVLCMPREMQKEDIAEWDAFRKDNASYDVEILLVDGNEIIRRMQDSDRKKGTDLIKQYFGVPQVLPKNLTNRLPLGPEIGLVGRDEIVDELRAMLDKEKCVALVRGLGGIGKTAVMQKVCDRILNDKDDRNHVAWITCGDSLEDDLLVLCDAFDIPKSMGKEESFNAVLRAMRGIEGKLYLFLDDLSRDSANKDLETLNALRPNVHVMITSRRQIKGIPHLELRELNDGSAIDMFYGYYERDKERKYLEDAKGIIDSESVKRHTLLVELLAKAANRSFDTLDVFRGELEKKGFFEVSKAKLDGAHDENLTIEESVTRLYGISGLTPEQRRIMSLFSIFTPEKVIYGKVVEWAGFDENDVEDLVQLGWLVRTEGGYVIHQIVKDSIARQVGDSLKIEEYGELIEKVADTDEYMPNNLEHTRVRERMVLADDVAKHVDGRIKRMFCGNDNIGNDMELTQISGQLFNNLGIIYIEQGEYDKALEQYEKAIDIYRRMFGTNHLLTAKTYNNISGVYRSQGNYKKALEFLMKAINIYRQEFGTDNPSLATTYNNIGLVYYDLGDYVKALEYYKKDLEINERMQKSDHLDSATAYNNMGLAYYASKDYAKALEYLKKALDIREQVLGSNHPDTATTYNNMAGALRAQGDSEDALRYFKKALEIREHVLGSDHPSTATTYNNIAGIFREMGNYSKALEYYKIDFEIGERVFGRDHPNVATIYNNMGLVYHEQKNYSKAQEYYKRALEIRERVLGNNHPLTAKTYKNIAEVYLEQKDYTNALEYYKKSYASIKKVTGSHHLGTERLLNNKANMNRSMRNSMSVFDQMTTQYCAERGKMTDQDIYDLLIRIDKGYDATEYEKSILKSVKKIKWEKIHLLPQCLELLSATQKLDLSETEVSNISVLSKITTLTNLDLSSTRISDISTLQGLTSLTNLNLSSTRISDISALQGLTSLISLNLSFTYINDIGILSRLTSLRYLDLSVTAVKDLGALRRLTELTDLFLWHTNVSDISALSGLTALTRLDLSRTEVSDINSLSELTALTYLGLRYLKLNRIPKWVLDLQLDFVQEYPVKRNIHIEGLKLKEQPIEIFGQSREQIRAFFELQETI